jgi:hypothetical protein
VCLLETIKRPLEEANMVRSSRVDKARWLLAVDCLLKVPMEEGVLDVQLAHGPGTGRGDAEDSPDGCRFDHRTERLVIVDAVLLGISPNNPACLVTGESAVRVRLDFEEPFACQDIGAGRSWNEAPGAVVNESLVLLSHGREPVRISQPTAIVGWNG